MKCVQSEKSGDDSGLYASLVMSGVMWEERVVKETVAADHEI